MKPKGTKTPRSAMAFAVGPAAAVYAGDPNTGAILTVIAIVILGLSTVLFGPEIGLVLVRPRAARGDQLGSPDQRIPRP